MVMGEIHLAAEYPLHPSDESIYDDLLARSGGQFKGDESAIATFMPIYRKLHTLGRDIGAAYAGVCKSYGLNPGKIDVVLGGGRAKGKPFKEDSDLDLFFYIQNPTQRLDSIRFDKHSDPLEAQDEQIVKMQQLLKKVKDVCNNHQVPDEFHIMGYGTTIPEYYAEKAQILLASIE